MQTEKNELDTKKPVSKPGKSKINIDEGQMDTTNTERLNKIALAAYYRAEKRGFAGSEADAMQDWLEAEKEVIN